MSFRKEKKFKLTKSDLSLLKVELLHKGMKFLHPKREINSCYFDTNNLKMFHDSEEGILPRKKIRLRWYKNNELLDYGWQFEIKKKLGISGYKSIYKMIYI